MNKIEEGYHKDNFTLKALAEVLHTSPTRLYTTAKKPVDGETYHEYEYNWDAIENFVKVRLGYNGIPDTLEQVLEEAIRITQERAVSDKRKAVNRGVRPLKTTNVDNNIIQERRFINHSMYNAEDGTIAGNFVVLKGDDNVYKIIHQTLSHTVLVPVDDEEGTVTSSYVKCVTNSVLNNYGMGPANTLKGINKRFNKMKLEREKQK